jgi:hypothetical protein
VTRSGSKWPGGMCATLTFNKDGLLIALCASLAGFELHLMKPKTLELLATYSLPQRPSTAAALMTLDTERIMLDTSGGAYYYLDHVDHVILADANQHIQRIGHRQRPDGSWEFFQQHAFDVSAHIKTDCMNWFNWFPEPGQCDPITAVTADYRGNIWFVTRFGLLGVVNPLTGHVETMQLEGEEMQNGITSTSDGVYVVTTHALYRLKVDELWKPTVVWRSTYDRGTFRKVGMLSQGSGTAPTVFGDFITINDNNDERVHVNVYYREAKGKRDDEPEQIVCQEPLFESWKSASDNSMVAIGNSIFMENNYGYHNGITQKDWSAKHIPGGIQRIDIDPATKTCKTVWRNPERAPSCVAKLGVETGLLYYYTFDDLPDGVIQWYLTAIDAHTGETAWKFPTGTGRSMDNNWAPVTLGPDGTAYVGVLGGIIAVYDS